MAGKLLKLAALGTQSAHRLEKKKKNNPKLKVKNIGFQEIPGWSSDEVYASPAGSMGSTPGWGTKNPTFPMVWQKKKKRISNFIYLFVVVVVQLLSRV